MTEFDGYLLPHEKAFRQNLRIFERLMFEWRIIEVNCEIFDVF